MSNVVDFNGMNARMAEIRREIADILSQINTACGLPTPVRSGHPNFPGHEWLVERRHSRWNVYVTDGHEDVLFVHHPGDMPGDVKPMELDHARDLAMALLAACHYADRHRKPLDIGQIARLRAGRKDV